MDTVFLKIKQAFSKFITPKILHIDNGTEFKNKLIKSYWVGKGIYFINGTPGHPQSQGAIEAFNKTVQNFLILAKDAQKDKFNLEHSMADFLCIIIKESILLRSTLQLKLLDDVRENTKIKETLKKWVNYPLKMEENTYQQLDKDRRQELLYLFIFEAYNQ